MKLSELKKQIEDTITELLNEVEEDPIKTATDAVKDDRILPTEKLVPGIAAIMLLVRILLND